MADKTSKPGKVEKEPTQAVKPDDKQASAKPTDKQPKVKRLWTVVLGF